jgi:hypothetical protein
MTSITRTQLLTYATVNSNRLLWAGLITLLAGTAILGAAQTLLAVRIYQGDQMIGRAISCSALPWVYGSTFAAGGLTTLVAARLIRKQPTYRRGAAVALAVGISILLYATILCSLRNSGTILHDVQMRGGSTKDFLMPNQGPLIALTGICSTIMIGGAGAMGLGFIGWLAARKAAQQPHAHVGPSETDKIEEHL